MATKKPQKRKVLAKKSDDEKRSKKPKLAEPDSKKKGRVEEVDKMDQVEEGVIMGDAAHAISDSDPEDGGADLEPAPKRVKAQGQGAHSKKSEKAARGKESTKSGSGHGPSSGHTSREAHQKQKQLAQERKAAKPLADEVQRAKKIWERLRLKSHVPKEERQKLVDELYSIISGRIKDFVLKHDAVRAVQTAIKYSTPNQRKKIAKELQGTYVQLAESRYAKFLIGKLLVHNDKEIRDSIIPEFYGKVRNLINHPEASWILDDIYRTVATKEQKAILLCEWYGPDFALFRPEPGSKPTADISEIIGKEEPGKKGVIMAHLVGMVNQLIQKKMTGFTMLHDAMLNYFVNTKAGSEQMKEFVEIIKNDDEADLLKNMAFTQSGARLVCLLLAHGTAKDRRHLLKAYKDTFQLMCADAHAYVVILAMYDVIDDTVATSKAVFPEILGKNGQKEVENIIFCANDPYARTTILYLFDGPSSALFPPSHAAGLALLSEIERIRETTSKKNAETRRQELIAALSPPLLAAVAASPNNLVASSFGCQFVADVLLSAVGDKTAALVAIAGTAAGDPQEKALENVHPLPRPHISRVPHGGSMLKRLVVGGHFDKATGKIRRVDPPFNFAGVLYPVIRDHVVAWATGPSSFTILAMLEADDFAQQDELRKILTQNKMALKKAVTTEMPVAGGDDDAQAKPSAKAAKKSNGGYAKKSHKGAGHCGNRGAQLILEKLQLQ